MFIPSIATATVSAYTVEFGQPIKNHNFKMFALSVATATVSVDTLSFCVYIFTTISFFVFTLRVATTTVSVDTIKFGQPDINHHINMFTLSVATATGSVDTKIFLCIYLQRSFSMCLH